jgi:hypothetical protein
MSKIIFKKFAVLKMSLFSVGSAVTIWRQYKMYVYLTLSLVAVISGYLYSKCWKHCDEVKCLPTLLGCLYGRKRLKENIFLLKIRLLD